MKTLDIVEAAAMLGLHRITLSQRAKAGQIPGVKIGRAWRFIEDDLIEYMRSQYRPAVKSQSGQQTPRSVRGHESKEDLEKEYARLLGEARGRRKSVRSYVSKLPDRKPKP